MKEKEVLAELAKRGNAEAAYRAGKLFAAEKNFTAAEHYYRIGVKYGHTMSMNALGTLYYTRSGRGRGAVRGLNLWYRAAKKGNEQSMANLALAYFTGNRLSEAKDYWTKAAAKGLPEAYHGLGKIAMRRNEPDEAEKNLRIAAEMGCAAAMNDLGILMQKLGKNKSARECFEKAANDGDKTATANLMRLDRKDGNI